MGTTTTGDTSRYPLRRAASLLLALALLCALCAAVRPGMRAGGGGGTWGLGAGGAWPDPESRALANVNGTTALAGRLNDRGPLGLVLLGALLLQAGVARRSSGSRRPAAWWSSPRGWLAAGGPRAPPGRLPA
jgi:hypothetical protein